MRSFLRRNECPLRSAKLWILVGTVVLCTACGGNPTANHSTANRDEVEPPTVVSGELTVIDARANATIADAKTSAAYLTILNGLDQAVTLRSIETDVATAELHETVEKDGVLRMVPHEGGFEIDAGTALVLAPGGKHLMLMNLKSALATGNEAPLTLNFDNAETIEVNAAIVAAGSYSAADQPEGHGEHEHESDAGHGEALTLPQEIIDAAAALDVDHLHAIDEALNEGGEIEADFANTVEAYTEALNKIEWPTELEKMIDELNGSLGLLEEALSENDPAQAKTLAAEVHDLAHRLGTRIDEADVDEHIHD